MKPTFPLTHTLGYPRIGEKRELKKATEAYWAGKLSLAELEQTGQTLRRQNWLTQQAAGIDLIPSNDFSFYDQMLDLTCLVGNVPPVSVGAGAKSTWTRASPSPGECGWSALSPTRWFQPR